MFHIIRESDTPAYSALIIGVLFIAAVRILYSMNVPQAKRILLNDIRKILLFFSFFKKFFRLRHQFFAGIALASIAFAVVTIFYGDTFSRLAQIDSAVSNVPFIHAATRTVVDTSKPWTYDFSTQLDGPVDPRIFNIENGSTKADYNNEKETFTNRTDNVRVENGVLVLEAKPENKDGKAYTSGRIDTLGSFSFTNGTLEVTAKLPRGAGTWPAAWLMPSNPRYQATDFPSATDQNRIYTLNGELDFLESVGYLQGQNIPAAHSYNSLGQADQYTPGFVANPYDEFHRYGIVKTPSLIEFTIDGKVYARREKTNDDPLSWPFDQPYYLILNLSLGGTWAGKHGIDDSWAPWQYQIKSVSYTPSINAN